MKKDIYYILAIVILVIILLRSCEGKREAENLYNASQDTLTTYVDKDGLNVAKIGLLQTKSKKDFISMRTKDSVNMELQALVKKTKLGKQGSVTIIKGDTKIDTIIKTQIVYVDSIPEYHSKLDLGGWVLGNIVAKPDKTQVSLSVKNEYVVTLGVENTGFLSLGPKKHYAEVKNLNPYSKVSVLRTYQVQVPAPKRFGVGPVVAYGLGSNLQPEWFVGFGVNFTLFRF